MNHPEDPTLGELEREGKIHPELALLYGRILGGDWRQCRLSRAIEAIVHEARSDRHGESGKPGAHHAA